MATKFQLGGQTGWYHESDVDYGYFHTYDSFDLDNMPRKVHILLPKDYEEKKRRYPVVYMNDGQTAFFPNSPGSRNAWEADEVINCLYRNNLIEPVIIVAVYPRERLNEYMYVKNYTDLQGHFVKGGGIDEYSYFLANKLKPFIDEHYYTNPDSKKTLIVGSSDGGVASLYTACKYSDKFGLAASMSPSFCYEFGLRKLINSVHEEPFLKRITEFLNKSACLPKLWLDWGMLEHYEYNYCPDIMLYLTRNFQYRFNKNIFYFEDPYGYHNEAAWSYRFNLVIIKFYFNSIANRVY